MSLTKVSYSMINGACINVKDYGAVGDGVQNDTNAIQAALTAAITNGTAIYFPSGDYVYQNASTFKLDLEAASHGLVFYGDGQGTTRLLIDCPVAAFTVTCDPRYQFICKDIAFRLEDVATNTDATCFYVCRDNGIFGVMATFGSCNFVNWTNSAIHMIRATNCKITGCYFFGNNFYTELNTSAKLPYNAAIRLWGADGTSVSQDHSFSNMILIEDCIFNYITLGIDGWNLMASNINTCSFEGCWIGVLNRPNWSAPLGIGTSTEKGGGANNGFAFVSITNSWFESLGKYNISTVDVDLATGADVNPTRFGSTYNLGSSNLVTNNLKSRLKGNPYGLPFGFVPAEGSSLYNSNPDYIFWSVLTNNPDEFYYRFLGSRFVSYRPIRLGADSAANEIKNYEVGAWTPALAYATPGSSSFTYSVQSGNYVKIGHLITMNGRITLSAFSKGSASGSLRITGLLLPTTNAVNGANGVGAVAFQNMTLPAGTTVISIQISVNQENYVTLAACGSATTFADVDPSSNTTLQFSFSYLTDF